MCKPRRRWIVLGLAVSVLVMAPVVAWMSLTHQPRFYRRTAAVPPERRRAERDRFVSQSARLYNDIHNEPTWEAIFTDEEVNAWLAQDLVTHFADQLPPQVHDPRVAFEPDRVTLAFGLDRGPIRMIVWVVARVQVPEENQLALTVEKIRAGALPIDADPMLERISAHAHAQGLDLRWVRDGDNLPVALIHYQPDPDSVLERLQVRDGSIHLAGRSTRSGGKIASPTLPRRKVLQSTFPRIRKVHGAAASSPSTRRSSASPAI